MIDLFARSRIDLGGGGGGGAQDGAAVMPVLADRDGICLSQTRASAGALLLNGVAVSGGSFTVGHPGGFLVQLYSGANLSGLTFTITGLNKSGGALVEAIAGPNAGYVLTAAHYSKVTSVTVSATMATEVVEVGFNFPLFVVSASAKGRLFTLLNPITALIASQAHGLITIEIPSTLWRAVRAFQISGVVTFVAGTNKNPLLNLNANPIKDFGAADGGVNNALRIFSEVVRSAHDAQRATWDYLWGGFIENNGVTALTEDDDAAVQISLPIYVLEDTGVAVLEAFTVEMINTP